MNCDVFFRDITNMKGTIVAQVDSSESFQEFCSTGCLGAYENKQNPPKSGVKTKCTVCGKLTEVSLSLNNTYSSFTHLPSVILNQSNMHVAIFLTLELII